MKEETPDYRNKVGVFFNTYNLEVWPHFYARLEIRQVTTNVIRGRVAEKDLRETRVLLNGGAIERLKKILKEYDARTGKWNR